MIENSRNQAEFREALNKNSINLLIGADELQQNRMAIKFFAGCFVSDWDAFTSPADYSLTSELISRDFGISANLIAQLNETLFQGKQ